MMISEKFADLSANLDAKQSLGALSKIGHDFGIKHFTYFGHRLKPYECKNVVITTYRDEWIRRYSEKQYELIDPVILGAMGGFLPVDWSIIPKHGKVAKCFFGEAAEMGVCEHGLSIPIRDENNDFAIFSINADMGPHDWGIYQPTIVADITYLAHLFHQRLRHDAPGSKIIPVRLAPREKEVLTWAAYGKTSRETGEILSIAEGTVVFYLRNICYKLGVANKTQAVAVAIQDEHIKINSVRHDAHEAASIGM